MTIPMSAFHLSHLFISPCPGNRKDACEPVRARDEPDDPPPREGKEFECKRGNTLDPARIFALIEFDVFPL